MVIIPESSLISFFCALFSISQNSDYSVTCMFFHFSMVYSLTFFPSSFSGVLPEWYSENIGRFYGSFFALNQKLSYVPLQKQK